VASGTGLVKDGASQVKDGADQVDKGASKVQENEPKITEAADKVKQGSSDVQNGAEAVEKGSEELQNTLDPSLMPDSPVKEYVEGNVELAEGSSQVAEGSSKLAEGSVQLAEGSSKLANASSKVAQGSSKVAEGSSKLADGSVQLAEGSLSLAAGSQMLSNAAAQALYTASGALASSANSLSGITGINESALGDYFYAPIKLDRHEVFPVPNYGSNVSPFYLVLSMWVGALITCVMMEPKSSAGTKYSPFEMYAGKLLFYVIMSILQASVTLIGAYLLGIYVDNYPLFTFSCILVSVVFMILIYSVISAIGNVGKGIIVVLLVLQISATGGIYPIQIMHEFFQTLYPYMPMTYAIDLIREAQLGVVWSNYLPSLTILLAIGVVTVVLAVLIKEKADKASKYFEERLDESGLF
jgi:putative membrane protein